MPDTTTAVTDTDTGTYAWIVDHTLTSDEHDDTALVEEPDPKLSANGTTGPYNAPADLLARLEAGEGRRWRTLYDPDDERPEEQWVSHEGRYLDVSDVDPARADEVDADAEGGPLYDFTQPNSGAIVIQYLHDDGTWKTW